MNSNEPRLGNVIFKYASYFFNLQQAHATFTQGSLFTGKQSNVWAWSGNNTW